MARKPRQLSKSGFYHVVIKGINNSLMFESDNDYYKYLDILEKYKLECNFNLFAYCLMSNHIHIILKVNEVGLSTVFQKINTHYALWFNKKYQRSGPLQNERFHSEPIEDLNYLWTAIRYIHNNPRKAGLESVPGKSYKWSSIYEYQYEKNLLIDRDFVFTIFPQKDFLEFNMMVTEDECLEIKEVRKSLPDDVAKEIIIEVCHCNSISDFQKLSLVKRDKYIRELKRKRLSFRQINRLTGVSLGIIQRIKV